MKKKPSQWIVSIVILTGVWAIARHRPITEGPSPAPASQLVACSRCEGTARVDQRVPCKTCKGTGKAEWNLGSKPDGGLKRNAPMCTLCRGTGRVEEPGPCPVCNGRGKVNPSAVTVLQEGPSWLDRMIEKAGFEMPGNPRPWQWPFTRKVPLVWSYIERQPARRAITAGEWSKVRRAGEDWVVDVRLDTEDDRGARVSQHRRFSVQYRQVVGSEKLATP